MAAAGRATAALALAGCAGGLATFEAPKSVQGQPLPPYQFHEECVRLAPGDRLDYAFEASEPVAFNIHYRDGDAVLLPVDLADVRSDAGVFAPLLAQHYCLTWEAGAAGATIDYRLRVRRARS
jgi:hypothetical protein